MDIIELSEQLLYAVKSQGPTGELEEKLAGLSMANLIAQLRTDGQRKAFWINIYNAYFQILAGREQMKKPAIFRESLVRVAEELFSLDDIEHGILRKYRAKFSLGYLPSWRLWRKVRNMAVEKIDYRIHFALNCGAKSCPPIAFYSADKIEAQLDLSTLSFLESETEEDTPTRTIHVSRLLFWFLADFGGYRGIRLLLREKLSLDTKGKRIRFKSYDWEEYLHYFS